MSYYDADWTDRAAIAIDNRGNSGAKDCQFSIPSQWGYFWDRVLSTGFDLRAAQSDGRQLIDHKRATWVHSTRNGVIELDNVNMVDDKWNCLWLYFGHPAAPDVTTVFTASSPALGQMFPGRPSRWHAAAAERPDAARPRTDIQKTSSAAGWVWFDFRGDLYTGPLNAGKYAFEEITSLTSWEVLNGAGSTQAGMIDLAKVRFLDGQVGVWLQAGTSGTPYVGVCKVLTTQGRTLEARVRIPVRDPSV